MNKTLKRTAAALGVASLIVVGAASAQDTTAPAAEDAVVVQDQTSSRAVMLNLVLEYTGLDQAGLQEALANGSTLTALIEANGRTVEDFTAAVLAEYGVQAADRRLQFEENLAAVLSGEQTSLRGLGFGRGGFGVMPGGDFGGRGGAPGMGDFGGRGGRGHGGAGFQGAPDTSDSSSDSATDGA
ncbi:MAG: hypothetical protein L6Q98_18390 [Anaerolineae bacterium]|nr:hypothetical protein [Anaerolineae bacterium]NUQ05903.1 hypothetical protein [Anaerolineae bacterium]